MLCCPFAILLFYDRHLILPFSKIVLLPGTSRFRSSSSLLCQTYPGSLEQVRCFPRHVLVLCSNFVDLPDCHGSVQQVCSFARHIMVPFSKFVVFLDMSWFRSSSLLFFPGISGFHSASLPLRTTCTRRRT